jgi:ribokinase
MPEVVALGDINLDLIIKVGALPQPGGEAMGERAVMSPGGSAANTASALAALSVDVGLIACVGQDPLGEMALERLQAAGVDTSQVQRTSDAPTGLMFIPVTPDGERTIFGVRGANAHLRPEPLNLDYIRSARLLHLSGYALLTSPQRDAALTALRTARQADIPISLDPGVCTAAEQRGALLDVLPGVTMLMPGEYEARLLTGRTEPEAALREFLARSVTLVAMKLGARGALLADGDESLRLPAFRVHAVDSTGAGDAFNAGMLFGWLRGLSLGASGVLASALGALTAAREGAGASPSPREACGLLRQALGEPDWREWQPFIRQVLVLLADL